MSSYATPANFATYGLPDPTVGGMSSATIQAALDAASNRVDGYLADKYTLPISTPYPLVLVQTVCQLAQFDLLCVRGFDPELSLHNVIRMRYEDAISWCKDIASRRTLVAGLIDATPNCDTESVVVQPRQDYLGCFVASRSHLRGF